MHKLRIVIGEIFNRTIKCVLFFCSSFEINDYSTVIKCNHLMEMSTKFSDEQSYVLDDVHKLNLFITCPIVINRLNKTVCTGIRECIWHWTRHRCLNTIKAFFDITFPFEEDFPSFYRAG